MARIPVRAGLVGAVCTATTLTGVPVGAAASTTPPVVSITMTGTKAKISGASHLRPGWTTFKLTAPKGHNAIWLYTLRGAATGSKASGTAGAVHRIRAEDPAGASGPSEYDQEQADAAAAKQRASDVTSVENAFVALGGVDATKGHSRTVT